jgi:hypothetical protein
MIGLSIDKYREQHPDKPNRGTIYNWINKGYLNYYRLPNGRIRITGEKKKWHRYLAMIITL